MTIQTSRHQARLEESFDRMVTAPSTVTTRRILNEGDLVGRLEIPRLNLSVMVMEGIASETLRLGAGHIPGTSLPGEPGNAGIAAHRDTFFRPLASIRENDTITFETVTGKTKYRVTSTSVVMPDETHVLKARGKDMITLVTCFPFRYVGPAPKRFIVHATKILS
jgi:sortase A